MSKRIRRTKVQLEAGMTVNDVRSGVSIEEFLSRKKEKDEKSRQEKEAKIKSKVTEVIGSKAEVSKVLKNEHLDDHTKVVQVVKIIYGEDEAGRSAQQIIDELFCHCKWEHKKVDLDKNFRATMLNTLGKDRWRLVFTHDPRILDKASNKPVQLYFQRSICPDNPKRKRKRSTI